MSAGFCFNPGRVTFPFMRIWALIIDWIVEQFCKLFGQQTKQSKRLKPFDSGLQNTALKLELLTFYQVGGKLLGPDGILTVLTIWLLPQSNDKFRFVTLKPMR